MLILTNAQKVPLALRPLDAYGNPARIDGVPSWNNSDAAIGALAVDPDGMSAVFTTAGPLGAVQVSATADADLGAGVRPLTATIDLQVEAAEAVSLGIVAGTPQPK